MSSPLPGQHIWGSCDTTTFLSTPSSVTGDQVRPLRLIARKEVPISLSLNGSGMPVGLHGRIKRKQGRQPHLNFYRGLL
jgi:hypothetical protein